MRETLYNQRFEDIYFSPDDGLAETRHVFLGGNDLPERWTGRSRFTIAETGFGTGLNFLAAWALFEETAQAEQVLDYVSFELYPLAPAEIRAMLGGMLPAPLSVNLEELLAHYPIRAAGFHRIILGGGRVRLTLVFDDVNRALPELDAPQGIDAWFLDGFAPAKNPQMWTDVLFTEMARLSREGASVATFTAAGAVRRGLAAAGFAVEKKRGFGRKRDMTVARFTATKKAEDDKNNSYRIAVIGGGLAGTGCAYALGRLGLAVTLFEKADRLASGASGNSIGLYNPRFTAQRGAESEFYTAAFAQALRTFGDIAQAHDIGFRRCGALHLANSPEKEKRFRALRENWGWHGDHLRYCSPSEASQIAGIGIDTDALYLPDSGQVCPQALCEAYALGADIRLNAAVQAIERRDNGWSVEGESFDAVVIAGAVAARDFAMLSWLPLHTVRGQISAVQASAQSARLQCNLCYGGYLSAPYDGQHMLGSTFQKWLDDVAIRDEDHRENLEKLAADVPALGGGLTVTGGRAALRTASQDHFPVIGAGMDGQGGVLPGLYVSTAHGSHGILSSLAGAYLIGDMLTGQPRSLPRSAVLALNGSRFPERARRKDQR